MADGSATPDQVRAAKKREDAAKAAAAASDASREQAEQAERSAAPKGRKASDKSES